MDSSKPAYTTIDEYIAGFPEDIQQKLRELRRVIHETAPEASEKIQDGDEVSIDFDSGVITNETKGETYPALPFPDFIKDIMAKGGLIAQISGKNS